MIKKLLMIGVLLCTPLFGSDKTDVCKYIKDISVLVDFPGGMGSGVIFVRPDRQNNLANFVLTAGHVIQHAKLEIRNTYGDNVFYKRILFPGLHIIKKELDPNSDFPKGINEEVNVITFSPLEKWDIAILQLRKPIFKKGVILDTKNMVDIGTPLYHVGRLHTGGDMGLTFGILSQHNVDLEEAKNPFDIMNLLAIPGCSGGGIWNEQGQYVGMFTRYSAVVPGITYMNTLRSIVEWTKMKKLEWVINPSLPYPTDEEISKIELEDQ